MFDYIVIGGGSAGCAVAARLADNPTVRVCLLEAGPDDNSVFVKTPAACAAVLPTSNSRNYGFKTVRQKHLNNRHTFQPRGRGLGGSSSLNAMIYTRGDPIDYDEWRDLGNPGWGWDDVLPVFKRGEDNELGANEFHGAGGPLHVSNNRNKSPWGNQFLAAAQTAGHTLTEDFNGAKLDGVGWYQVTQYNGQRWNAARAYVHSRHRANLVVKTGAQVLKINFNTERRATGVTVVIGGVEQVLTASAEVILSAGAFHSPQILMLSGIGPASHLQQMDIPVLQDSPLVGGNLQDHLDIILIKKLDKNPGSPSKYETLGYSVPGAQKILGQIGLYRREGRGMLTSNFAEAGGFLRSMPGLPAADIQLHFVIAMADDHNRTINWGHGYSCHVCVLKPKSRGMVRLKDNNPRSRPLIDPNFLDHPDDLAGMLRGFKIVRNIFAQPELQKLGGRELYFDGIADDDDEGISRVIRKKSDTIYHPVGTCRMGSDDQAVVDSQLRVRGVHGLRVVDASVMPTLVRGNTNAPSIMIGERAADFIQAGRAR